MKIYVDLGTGEQGFDLLEPIHKALLTTGSTDRCLWFRGIDGCGHRIADWRRAFLARCL